MISVVIPTVDGREEHLERCVKAYRERTVALVQLIIIRNRACCGDAWNEGAELAEGDFLHWTADDLEPAIEWDVPARECGARGEIPAPVIYKPDGSIESCGGWWDRVIPDGEPTTNTSVVPFCTRAQWEDIRPHLPAHYYTDNWFTYRAHLARLPVIVRSRYAFIHHWAQPGRGAGMTEQDRMAHDREVFEEAA